MLLVDPRIERRAPNPIEFQAKWTPENCHLQSSIWGIYKCTDLTSSQKTTLIWRRIIETIVHIFSFGLLRYIAKSYIVLSTTYSAQTHAEVEKDWKERWIEPISIPTPSNIQQAKLRETYEGIPLKLKTPDGVDVRGIFYRHMFSAGQDIPTILCFNGNGQLAHTDGWDWLLKKGCRSQQPFNVLTFDYPTSDLTHSRDLVAYADTLFQAARAQGISENNIHSLGLSLGGALSVIAAELHPLAGRVVNLKSFESLGKVITDPEGVVGQNVRSDCLRRFLAKAVDAMGWSIEPATALNKLKDKTLFVYTKMDEVLPPSVTGVNAVGEANLNPDRVIKLRLKHWNLEDHHNAPLRNYQDENGQTASNRIVNFILGREVFPRRNPLPQG
jgi:hypothetical protein